jgi:hypothetical protein
MRGAAWAFLVPIATGLPACGARTDVGFTNPRADARSPEDAEAEDGVGPGDGGAETSYGSCPLAPPVPGAPCYANADCTYFPSNVGAVCSFTSGDTNCSWFTEPAGPPSEASCSDWALYGLNCPPGVAAECIQVDENQCCTCEDGGVTCGGC